MNAWHRVLDGIEQDGLQQALATRRVETAKLVQEAEETQADPMMPVLDQAIQSRQLAGVTVFFGRGVLRHLTGVTTLLRLRRAPGITLVFLDEEAKDLKAADDFLDDQGIPSGAFHAIVPLEGVSRDSVQQRVVTELAQQLGASPWLSPQITVTLAVTATEQELFATLPALHMGIAQPPAEAFEEEAPDVTTAVTSAWLVLGTGARHVEGVGVPAGAPAAALQSAVAEARKATDGFYTAVISPTENSSTLASLNARFHAQHAISRAV